MKFLQYFNPFRKPSAQHMRETLIEEADRLAIEHHGFAEKAVADAEGHSALAEMYEARAERLRQQSLRVAS